MLTPVECSQSKITVRVSDTVNNKQNSRYTLKELFTFMYKIIFTNFNYKL